MSNICKCKIYTLNFVRCCAAAAPAPLIRHVRKLAACLSDDTSRRDTPCFVYRNQHTLYIHIKNTRSS